MRAHGFQKEIYKGYLWPTMKREPDNATVIDDDSGSYDVRDLRGRRVDPELVEVIIRAVKDIQPQVSYSEGNNDRLLKWLLGVVSVLLCAFIIGSIVGYGNIQSLTAVQQGLQRVQEGQQQQINWLINRLSG